MLSVRCLTRGIRRFIPSRGEGKGACTHPPLLGSQGFPLRTPLGGSRLREAAGPSPLRPRGCPPARGTGHIFQTQNIVHGPAKNNQPRREHNRDSSKIQGAQQSRAPRRRFHFHTAFMTSWPVPGFLFHRKFQHQKTQIRSNEEGFGGFFVCLQKL